MDYCSDNKPKKELTNCFLTKESETRVTARIIKHDPDTYKIKKNAIYNKNFMHAGSHTGTYTKAFILPKCRELFQTQINIRKQVNPRQIIILHFIFRFNG